MACFVFDSVQYSLASLKVCSSLDQPSCCHFSFQFYFYSSLTMAENKINLFFIMVLSILLSWKIDKSYFFYKRDNTKDSFTLKSNFLNPHYPFTLQLISLKVQKHIFSSICRQYKEKLQLSGTIWNYIWP